MRTINQARQILVVMMAMAWALHAQDSGAAAIQKKLQAEYQLTKITDDKSDIVTAGSVILLHKDKVMMVAATSTVNPCMNTYRDGKITPAGACGLGSKIRHIPGLSSRIGADKAPATRNFVSGEKFWVTNITVKDNGKDRGAIFDFFTDATPAGDQGIRYKGQLTIPFGAVTPSPDEAFKAIAEVITVVPPEDAKDENKQQPASQGGQQPAQQAAQQPAQQPEPPRGQPGADAPAAPAAALEAPPAPPPDPVNISEGQTVAQVEAAMGQPQKKLTVGPKMIYVYKDLKITFVKGKVTNVE